MNVNNQTSLNLKQVKLQAPITSLEYFAKSVNELVKMYPTMEKEEDKSD